MNVLVFAWKLVVCFVYSKAFFSNDNDEYLEYLFHWRHRVLKPMLLNDIETKQQVRHLDDDDDE